MSIIRNKQVDVNSNFDFKNYRLINLSSPLNNNDAANKLYVDQNTIKSGGTINGDLILNGDLYVSGITTTIDVNNVNIRDNIILLNSGETTDHVSLTYSGIEISRGSSTNYRIVFNDDIDVFQVGFVDSLQTVALREDNPNSSGVSYWNNTIKRFDTSNKFRYDGNDLYLSGMTQSGTSYVVYYDLTNGRLTYESKPTAGSTEHNTLNNIQGGTTNEYYHLTSVEHSITINISSTVSTETSQRISVDSSLNSAISTGNSVRISVDSSLTSAISTEISQRISVDSSLTSNISTDNSVRISVDTSLISALSNEISIRTSVDSSLSSAISSVSDVKPYQLYQPNGTNAFVYTDNSGTLHIDGNIVQSGTTYETHAEQLYTTKNMIILRSGATAGMSNGEYAGFKALKYDGINDGYFVFDSGGTARVGDIGSEQPLTTRIESPTNGEFAYWESGNTRLNFKSLTINDVDNLSTELSLMSSVDSSLESSLSTEVSQRLSTESSIISTITTNSLSGLTEQYNTILGYNAGLNNSNNYNVLIGSNAGISNSGASNTFIGYMTGYNNISGFDNTYIGDGSGYNNNGSYNTYLGNNTGANITNGAQDVIIGSYAGYGLEYSSSNVIIGTLSAQLSLTGISNVYIGTLCGHSNNGSKNVFIGHQSGRSGYTNLDNSIFIGTYSGIKETQSNTLIIDSLERTSEIEGRNKSLLYGKFDTLLSNQFLRINGKFYVSGLTSGSSASMIYYNTSTNEFLYGSLPVSSQWVNNGANIYYNNGNVSIGNSATTYRMMIGSSVGNESVGIYSSPTGYASLYFGDTYTGTGSYEGIIEYNNNNNTMYFGTDHAYKLALNNSGNLGIGFTGGTELSNYKLSVNGNIFSNSSIISNLSVYSSIIESTNYLKATKNEQGAGVTLSLDTYEINYGTYVNTLYMSAQMDDGNYINDFYINCIVEDGGNLVELVTNVSPISINASDTLFLNATNGIQINNILRLNNSTATTAYLNIPHGIAPTSPNNGDIWTTTSGLYARINGSTIGPFGTGVSGSYLQLTGGTLTGGLSGTSIYMSGDIYAAGTITSNSDIRNKNVLGLVEDVLNKYDQINPIIFKFKNDEKNLIQCGYSAQELYEVFPHTVYYDNDLDRYGINSLAINAINTVAIKELKQEIEQLKDILRKNNLL